MMITNLKFIVHDSFMDMMLALSPNEPFDTMTKFF